MLGMVVVGPLARLLSRLPLVTVRLCHAAPSPSPGTPSTSPDTPSIPPVPDTPPTFASLVRHCKFTTMGDPVGKVVVGRVYHVVDEDLYIDFGHKFGTVCKLPREDRRSYLRGTEVRLRVNSLELSRRFLGYDKDMSLLEADCSLLGLNK